MRNSNAQNLKLTSGKRQQQQPAVVHSMSSNCSSRQKRANTNMPKNHTRKPRRSETKNHCTNASHGHQNEIHKFGWTRLQCYAYAGTPYIVLPPKTNGKAQQTRNLSLAIGHLTYVSAFATKVWTWLSAERLFRCTGLTAKAATAATATETIRLYRQPYERRRVGANECVWRSGDRLHAKQRVSAER